MSSQSRPQALRRTSLILGIVTLGAKKGLAATAETLTFLHL